MPQVAVQIAGKTYRMACDEGQEPHLMELARRFDASIEQLRGSFGEIGDQRLTVMAGVMITDELVEANRRIAALEAELKRARAGGGAGASADTASQRASQDEAKERDAKLARALVSTADKLETLAERLEKA